MWRIQHPEFLIALLVLLPLLLFYFYWHRLRLKRKIAAIGNESLVTKQLIGFDKKKDNTRLALFVISISLVMLGGANLQRSGKMASGKQAGVDVMLALDVSRSMTATDVLPNRLLRAKQLIQLTLDKFKGHRVGLVLFAGRAYVQVPLTTDYSALRMMLQTADPNMIPQQGTVLAEAITLADEGFSKLEKKYKLLVLLSDGEDHDERAVDVARGVVKNGVKIMCIGIGSPQGSNIIDPTTGQAKQDEQGEIVLSRLNESELKEIAEAGNGTYIRLSNSNAVASEIADVANGMEAKNQGNSSYRDYDSYGQYCLLLGFLMLLIFTFLPKSKASKNYKSEKATNRKTILASAAFAVLCVVSFSNTGTAQERKLVADGNAAFTNKSYDTAAINYKAAQILKPGFTPAIYNYGNALYNLNLYDSARAQMMAALKSTDDAAVHANAQYNIGNSYLKEKKWQEAIDAYKDALRKSPGRDDAKYNLSYAQQKLKNQQQQDKDKNNKNDDNKDKEKDEKENKDKKDDKGENDKQQPPQNKEKNEQEEKQKPSNSKLSKEQADRLLKALQQKEKGVRERANAERGDPQSGGKDW